MSCGTWASPQEVIICAGYAQVDSLLQQGSSLYSPAPDMKGAIESLIQSNPTSDPGPATLSVGQGAWEACIFGGMHICMRTVLAMQF